MRARSREINIFSMSALDLFASALGAFILIAVVLFPYFPNTGDSPERVAEVRAQLAQVQSQLQASQSQLGACETQRQEIQAALDACEEQRRASVSQDALGACESRNQQLESNLETCQAQARKKFLLVLMSWGTEDDIDLHVIDPAGREFFYQSRSFPAAGPSWKRIIPAVPAMKSGCILPPSPAPIGCTTSIFAENFRQVSGCGEPC